MIDKLEFIGIGILFSICLGNYIKERTTSTLLMLITYIILVIIKILKYSIKLGVYLSICSQTLIF